MVILSLPVYHNHNMSESPGSIKQYPGFFWSPSTQIRIIEAHEMTVLYETL